jgi:hypothetical protein
VKYTLAGSAPRSLTLEVDHAFAYRARLSSQLHAFVFVDEPCFECQFPSVLSMDYRMKEK